MNDSIVFYDFADLFYSSYFLLGFTENAEREGYRFVISKKLPSILKDPPLDEPLRRILFSICIFKARFAGEEFYFCIDTRDSSKPDERGGLGYSLPLLERVKFYFKTNYDPSGVEGHPQLKSHARKIIPVDVFFPVKVPPFWRLRPRFTECPEAGWSRDSLISRMKELASSVSLSEVRNLRKRRKELDFFFVMTYYGDDVHQVKNEFRYQLITELQKLKGVRVIAGFASRRPLPGKYATLQIRRYTLRQYLEALSKSRVGIYVRGMHDCLSYKLGQFLALGLPVVGQSLANNRESLYQNPYFKEQFHYDDIPGILHTALESLGQPGRLEEWGRSNASVFEEKYAPQAETARMLSIMKVGK